MLYVGILEEEYVKYGSDTRDHFYHLCFLTFLYVKQNP